LGFVYSPRLHKRAICGRDAVEVEGRVLPPCQPSAAHYTAMARMPSFLTNPNGELVVVLSIVERSPGPMVVCLCGMPACGQAVGCGVCDTPELWRARRGPVCACTRVCWCRRIFTYTSIDSPCECEQNNPDSLDARLFFTVVLAVAPAVTMDEASSLSNGELRTGIDLGSFVICLFVIL